MRLFPYDNKAQSHEAQMVQREPTNRHRVTGTGKKQSKRKWPDKHRTAPSRLDQPTNYQINGGSDNWFACSSRVTVWHGKTVGDQLEISIKSPGIEVNNESKRPGEMSRRQDNTVEGKMKEKWEALRWRIKIRKWDVDPISIAVEFFVMVWYYKTLQLTR